MAVVANRDVGKDKELFVNYHYTREQNHVLESLERGSTDTWMPSRNIPVEPPGTTGLRRHFQFPVPEFDSSRSSGSCSSRSRLWDCVGEDRTWGVVFVDHRPEERRGRSDLRLAARSKVSSGGRHLEQGR